MARQLLEKNKAVHAQYCAALAREKSRTMRDIAPIPAVEDPERKEACRLDLRLFLTTYFPHLFYNKFSKAHLELIHLLQSAILNGESGVVLLPRGFGKSVITIVAAIWAQLYGHRKYIVIVGASASAGDKLLGDIKYELLYNKTLAPPITPDTPIDELPATCGDFPAVTFPLRRIGTQAARKAGQTVNGQPTLSELSAKRIVLPSIEGEITSGLVIESDGLQGSLRGKNTFTSAGSMRPDLVILDDPQTDASAKSYTQTTNRYNLLTGCINGLAAASKSMATVVTATIIERDDLADQIYRAPQWRTVKYGVINQLPVNEQLDLWQKHNQIRLDLIARNEPADVIAKACNRFFKANKQALTAGLIPTWDGFVDPLYLSPLQKIMRLYFDDFGAFVREYMNDPDLGALSDGGQLTESDIRNSINTYPRGVIPLDCEYLTAGFDSQTLGIFWVITAHAQDGTSYVIDYGKHPNGVKSIVQAYDNQPLDQCIYYGYSDLMESTIERVYTRQDGAQFKVQKALIDAANGPTSGKINQFIRDYGSDVLIPSYGQARDPNTVLFNKKNKPGEMRGDGWAIPPSRMIPDEATRRRVRLPRHIIVDVNSYKSLTRQRLKARMGTPGKLSIFESDNSTTHNQFIAHLLSEYSKPLTGQYGTIDSWKLTPGKPNHYWDCLCYSMVGASILGIKTQGHLATMQHEVFTVQDTKPQRKRVKGSSLQANSKRY